MKKEEFDKYLKTRYHDQIAWYDKKAIWNHNAYRAFQWAAIIMSALTPLLIVIGILVDVLSIWIAVGVAVLVAISTTALKTFKYQENWINYRTTCETLKKEIHFYEAGIQGYENAEDKEAQFVQRVESLVSRENTLWVFTRENEERAKHR